MVVDFVFQSFLSDLIKALELIERGIIRADDFVDGECALSRLPDLFRSMATGNRAVKTLIQVRQ